MHNFRFRLLHPLILKICFDSNFWRIFVIRNHCASLAVLPLLTQLLLHFTQVWLACYSLFFFTKGKDLLLFTIVTNELVVELQGGQSMFFRSPDADGDFEISRQARPEFEISISIITRSGSFFNKRKGLVTLHHCY